MSTHLKKWLSLASIACTASIAYADNMQSKQQQQQMTGDGGKYREITPNAGPRVMNGADVFVVADFIYWTVRLDNVNYTASGAKATQYGILANGGKVAPGNAGTGLTGSRTMDNKFDPGFKVALGLDLSHDGWDTLLRYTWIQPNHTATTSYNTAALQTSVNPAAASTASSYYIQFNNFDWELGRNFYVSQYLAIRPYTGLKGGWTRYHFNETGSGPFYTDSGTPLSLSKSRTYDLFKTWWVGIRSGLDSTFHFTKNWSLFSKLALAGIWEGFEDTTTEAYFLNASQSSSGTAGKFTTGTGNGSSHATCLVAEFQVGFCYDYWWSEDEYHFGLAASWEAQNWSSQGRFGSSATVIQAPSYADLTMQGFTLSFRFDF